MFVSGRRKGMNCAEFHYKKKFSIRHLILRCMDKVELKFSKFLIPLNPIND